MASAPQSLQPGALLAQRSDDTVLLNCAVIGLGANLGDPEAAFRAAAIRLRCLGTFVGASKLYRTRAIGPPQPDYLNAALHLRACAFDAPAFVKKLLEIEQVFGRVRNERWGPRSLDLDLLWAGDLVCRHVGAIVPHPRLTERAFALRPLLDLVPDAQDPLTSSAYQTVLTTMGASDLRIVGGEGWAG